MRWSEWPRPPSEAVTSTDKGRTAHDLARFWPVVLAGVNDGDRLQRANQMVVGEGRRSARPGRASRRFLAPALGLFVLVASGCGSSVSSAPVDQDEAETMTLPLGAAELPPVSPPEDVIPGVAAQLPSPADDSASVAEGLLDAINPPDLNLEITIDREGRPTNANGDIVGLDEPAGLACGNVEIALTAIDEGDHEGAVTNVEAAAARAGRSAMASVRRWGEPLADATATGSVDDLAALIGFLSVCAEGGYEL